MKQSEDFVSATLHRYVTRLVSISDYPSLVTTVAVNDSVSPMLFALCYEVELRP